MQDCYDAPLTFSRGQFDTMMLALLRCVYTGRNDSQVLMSMEQALPVHHSWLNFNRYIFSHDRPIVQGIPQWLPARPAEPKAPPSEGATALVISTGAIAACRKHVPVS